MLRSLGEVLTTVGRTLWVALRKVLCALRSAWFWWWNAFVKSPLAGLIVATVLVFVATLVSATFLRLVNPQREIVVAEFEVSAGGSGSLAVTGGAVAEALSDQLQTIMQVAAGASADDALSLQADRLGLQISPPQILPTRVGVKVAWFSFSLEALAESWDAFRWKRDIISGDMILEADQLTLRARSQELGPWESDTHNQSKAGFDSATHELAARMLTRLRPDVAGMYYWARQDFGRAEEVFRAWTAREPGAVEPFEYLAMSAHLAGDMDAAIPAYRAALERDSTAQLLVNLGSCLIAAGRFDDARTALDRALQLNPDDVETILIERGQARLRVQEMTRQTGSSGAGG